jgi:hypothetical protein
MNEQQFANAIRQHLNRGALRIDQNKLDRLAAARQQALAHQRASRTGLALAGANLMHHLHLDTSAPRRWMAAAAIAAAALLGAYWQAQQQIADLEAVDSELLSDDLPISAYLDKGFDSWLKKESDQ